MSLFNKDNQRKNILVHPKIQYGIFGYFALLLLFSFLAQDVSIVLFAKQGTIFSEMGACLDPHDAARHFLWIYIICSIMPFLSTILVGAFLLFRLSHRVVGPIYKINQVLEAHAKGEKVEPIVLRKGDYFQDLAENVNKITQKK